MTEKKNSSIVRRMFIAVGMGFVIGFICLYLKATLKGTSGKGVWNFIHALLFQDITQTKSLEGLGLFYIIGQLFMRSLQMMIVPLVITSLSLALCSLADPKRLGTIAGRTFITCLSFYVVAAALAGACAYFVMSSELCLIGYSLVLAMNYLPGMAVITLNVIGDAATNVIVCKKENALDLAKYNG